MTDTPIKSVAVVGATGNAGRFITHALATANFTVTALSRSSPDNNPFPTGVIARQTDYSTASLLSILTGVDAVVSAITTFNNNQQNAIVDAAAKAGVKRFLPSEYGMDTANPVVRKMAPEIGKKTDVVTQLRGKEAQMSWTALCVGTFFDWVGFNVKNDTAHIFDGGNVPISYTNMAQIGTAVVSILRHPDETANQYVYVDSFVATQNEVLSCLEKVTGRAWKRETFNSEQTRQEGMEVLDSGEQAREFEGMVKIIMAALFADLGLGYFGEKGKDWKGRLGLEGEELEGSVRRAVDVAEGRRVLL